MDRAIPIKDGDGIPFEENGIYIVLSALRGRAGNITYHWGLYISVNGGWIYHATNDSADKTWSVQAKNGSRIASSKNLRLALKVGSVKSTAKVGEADAILRAVPVPTDGVEYMAKYNDNFTCRIWVREALDALNEAKIVELTSSTENIEKEATSLIACMTKRRINRSIAQSKHAI